MKHRIFKISALFACGVLTLAGCRDGEAELLHAKLYFESCENVIEIDDQTEIVLDLQSRLSKAYSSDVNVSYMLADESLVDEYNAKYGREYLPFTSAVLDKTGSSIPAGDLYADAVQLRLSDLGSVAEGSNYLLPVRVDTGDVPVIDGSDIAYFVIRKPVRILQAASFNGTKYFKVPLTPLKVFNEVTYEAIVNVSHFGNNNTVMGCEGVMIMRIGDAGGGTVPKDILQVAGKSEMTWFDNPLRTGLWYHLAFTCAADGTANLYVNGERVIQGSFTMSSDLTAGGADYGFSVGMVPRFMWGNRPFNGLMSEVRLWDVVRSANQIRENMLNVDPNTPGLVAYYKLNGDLNDSSGNGLDPTDCSKFTFETLQIPIAIGGGLAE